MRTQLTLQVIAALICAGCASNSAIAQSPPCENGSGRLTVDEGLLEFRDKKNGKKAICVTVPGSFKINIKQPGNASHQIKLNDVRVHAKDSDGPMIYGVNDSVPNTLLVTISGTGNYTDRDWGFVIDVKDVGMLDPRVRVVGSAAFDRLLYDAINAALLEDFNLSINDVQALTPPGSGTE